MNSRIDLDNPQTWLPYKKTLCDSCFATCCTQEVEVTEQDLIRLNLLTPDEVEFLDTHEIFKILKSKNIVDKWSPKTCKYSLMRRNGRDCQFLDHNRRCTVYENRPKTCRDYPFPSSRPGFCPYKKKS